MVLNPPSQLTLPAFTLRAWSVGDAAPLATALAASEAHLRAWTPWVVDGRVPGLTLAERLAQHAADFDAGTAWVYGILDPDSGAVLGGCGLYPRIGPGALEIGYWLAAAHTGRGLATQASAALVRIAFSLPGVDRVEIRCDPGNTASARIPERLGFRLLDAPGPEGLQVWSLGRAEFVAADARGTHAR